MARNYANISTNIWRDDDFKKLSIAAQHAYFLVATQPDISAAGVLPLTFGRWASKAADANIDTLEAAFDELTRHRFICIDRETEELLVRSFVKWDGGYGNTKRRPVIMRAALEVESESLRAVIADEFRKVGLPTEGLPATSGEINSEQAPESAFPQENRLSDRASASDGVVVTKRLVLEPQPATRSPHSSPPAVVGAEEPRTETPEPSSANTTPGIPVNRSVVPAPRWSADNRKPTTPTAVYGRTAGLFPKPRPTAVETWMEIHQVIYRWLAANNYETFGLDEVTQIHKSLIAAHPGKSARYLYAVIGNNGCAAYATKIREGRNKKIADLVADMQQNLPQCEHGTPAGAHPHPTTGALLCAQCRRGISARPQHDTTDPDVQTVLTAYRGTRGNNILLGELLNITQQIEAFFAEGATLDQLIPLAESAGQQRISLIKAAGAAA